MIAGYRGILDFYEDKGLFVVRRWPRNKSAPPTPGEVAMQPVFARSSRLKKCYSATVEIAARRYSLGGSSTWQDNLTRAYYGKDSPTAVPFPPNSTS